MRKTDRRVQRTRDVLQQALIELLHEGSYDAITIQEIADRANVGRTTFYLHYRSKDALFMQCHEAIVSHFQFGPRFPRSQAVLLGPDAPPGLIAAYRHLAESRTLFVRLFGGKDGLLILQRLWDWSAEDIDASLRAAFPDADSAIPIDVLAHYLAGAQIALLHWWLEHPHHHTPETLAQTVHRLQRAAICDALGLRHGAGPDRHHHGNRVTGDHDVQ